jgi:S-layer homology domain
MRKKSTSQSATAHRPALRSSSATEGGSLGEAGLPAVASREGGFLNLRVLFGLFVMLAGVFLSALGGFGTFSSVFAQNGTTREQMTLALAQALAINPPACVMGQEMFNDVPASSPFCSYIEELSRRGITGGCAPGLFCPGDPVTRQQMAAFLVKVLDAVTQSEDFHIVGTAGEPAFQNGWHNAPFGGATAGFFKDALGIVELKGNIIVNGVGGATAFTLPAGYRPAEQLFMPCAGSGPIAANLILQSDGQLKPGC